MPRSLPATRPPRPDPSVRRINAILNRARKLLADISKMPTAAEQRTAIGKIVALFNNAD